MHCRRISVPELLVGEEFPLAVTQLIKMSYLCYFPLQLGWRKTGEIMEKSE